MSNATMYYVVERNNLKDLEETVTNAIKARWIVQGGICVTRDNSLGGLVIYSQAMVRTGDSI